MFTGIVQGLYPISHVQKLSGMKKFSVKLPSSMHEGLKIGASVSIDGACLSVVRFDGEDVWFDTIQETLNRTTLGELSVGRLVNIERSARFSDEIGGHLVSGHVFGMARISQVETWDNNRKVVFECPSTWMKYFFSKGYVAIDGISLTLVDVDPQGFFSVHLIPETLRVTTLGWKAQGARVNIELDSQTQAVVDTVERILERKGL